MSPLLLAEFQARKTLTRDRWATLLCVEPVSGPLAIPEALVHLIPDTLEQLYTALAKSSRAPATLKAAKVALPVCDCGNNPFRAFFVAGEQAVTETFVLLQARLLPNERLESDLAAVIYEFRRHAAREIDTFCGICEHRGAAPRCRHAAARRSDPGRELAGEPAKSSAR